MVETPENIRFWNDIFSKLYEDHHLKKIVWQSGDVDIKQKIDVVVEVVFKDHRSFRSLNYQVKTKGYFTKEDFYHRKFNLNIEQFDRYSDGDYKIDVLGFGVNTTTAKYAIVVPYKDFINLWIEKRDYWILEYSKGDYITLPFVEFLNIPVKGITLLEPFIPD